MSSYQNLPFERGETDSASNMGDLAGHQWIVDDIDHDNVPKRRTEHQITLRLVKNTSGIALLPKRLVTFKAGTNRKEVDGYATTTGADGKTVAVVDEYLPAAGVANNAYFYVVTRGPSLVLTDLAGADNNVIDEEDVLVALTAATSGATTAGRVKSQITSNGTTSANSDLIIELNGAFGKALSSKTTANTNADLLAFISNRWDC